MSGTSMDGIDVAVVDTDGHRIAAFGPCRSIPFTDDFRGRLRAFIAAAPDLGQGADLEAEFTDLNAAAVRALNPPAGSIDVIGFHGQTIWHRPHLGRTWQMGDGARLSKALRAPVCFDFRSADVAAGGQGAPLAPVFHAALVSSLPRPAAIVNLGGVGNITWVGGDGSVIGFDTGPGNGLLDDWMLRHTGQPMDRDGAAAARGTVAGDVLAAMMNHPFFDLTPPKSLDRFAFGLDAVVGLGVEDGAATLAAFTAAAVDQALRLCPAMPQRLFVTGGGRRNPTLMRMIADGAGIKVDPIEAIGGDGDHLEAQAFAFMAVRTMLELPISFPSTTGVARPMPGGRLVADY
jgi:anhydro-N-acetylmuramic acid kinase